MGLLESFVAWARSKSMWLVHYCAACGAIEFPPVVTSVLDWERYGYLPVPTPRQSDLYAGMGYLTKKSLKVVLRLLEQMPNPKWIVAGCNCTATGGLYWDSYATYKRLDQFMQVEGWVPGCMPTSDDWFALLTYFYNKVKEKPVNNKGSRKLSDAWEKIYKWEEMEREWAKQYWEGLKKTDVKVNYNFEEKFPECVEKNESLKMCLTTVDATRIREALKKLSDEGYILINNINTVDLPKNGVIEIYYVVEKPLKGDQVWVKTYVPRKNAVIDSVHDLYPLAYYIEREVYEKMGVKFRGNPCLRKWILDGNWEGPPPLRKDVDTAKWVVKVHYGGYPYGR